MNRPPFMRRRLPFTGSRLYHPFDTFYVDRHTSAPTKAEEEFTLMRLNKQVSNFSSSCEQLMAEAEASVRKLTEEEILLIEYYCREVLKKVVKRPPSKQGKESSEGGHNPNNPPLDSQISGSTALLDDMAIGLEL